MILFVILYQIPMSWKWYSTCHNIFFIYQIMFFVQNIKDIFNMSYHIPLHIYFCCSKVPFDMVVRKWFQHGTMCAGLDIKDAFLHIPMDTKVKKFLWFKWKGKLYEWQALPFGLKCSLGIFTFMVKPIVRFLRGRGISLTAYMENSQTKLDAGVRQYSMYMWLH